MSIASATRASRVRWSAYGPSSVWYEPTTGIPTSRATARPQTPTGPGVATWITSGRSASTNSSTSVGSGKRRSIASYDGTGSDQSGGKVTTPGSPGAGDATTTEPAKLPSAAAAARRRIVPATPLT